MNGRISCQLKNDHVPLAGDTCSFTCNTGYQFTGSVTTRTCQDDKTWSGSDGVCARGKLCIELRIYHDNPEVKFIIILCTRSFTRHVYGNTSLTVVSLVDYFPTLTVLVLLYNTHM